MKNVCASQNYVSQYELKDYPITDADIIARGDHAWNSALNTVNIGKYNLGWASIGMCTHRRTTSSGRVTTRKSLARTRRPMMASFSIKVRRKALGRFSSTTTTSRTRA